MHGSTEVLSGFSMGLAILDSFVEFPESECDCF